MAAPSRPSVGFPAFEILEPRLLLSDVSGHITADTVWDNTAEPYRVVGDLYVDAGATLTLCPGVTLRTDSYWIRVDGCLEGTGATLEATRGNGIEVRGANGQGGRLDLDGGTVRGQLTTYVRNWAEAEVTGVTFEGAWWGSAPVTYDAGSSGTVDNGHGSWNLSVASADVSVVNGIDVNTLTLSAPVAVTGGTIDRLIATASAMVTGSTIGYADLNSGSPTLTGNTIGYVNLGGGTPTINGSTFSDGTPIRISDPDVDTGGIVGNTYSAADPWVGIRGTLDGSKTLGGLDGLSRYVVAWGDLAVGWDGVLTLSPGVTLRTDSYWIRVDGCLEGTGATLEATRGNGIEVRGANGQGGRLDLDGGTVRGQLTTYVRNWAEAEVTGVTFEGAWWGSAPVTYDAGSSGTVDNGHGSWSLSVASTGVSVVNGIDVSTLDLWVPIVIADGTFDTLNLRGTFTAAEIAAIDHAGAGLVNLYGTIDCAGSSLALSSPWKMVGGTIRGGTVQQAANALWSTGRLGGAMVLSGGTYVPLPNDLIRSTNFVTVEAWFKTTQSGVIFGMQNCAVGQSPVDWQPVLYIGTDGKLRGKYWNNRATSGPMTSALAVNDGAWHHAAIAGNGNSQSLYLDGVLVATHAGQISHTTSSLDQIGTGFTGSPGDWPSGNGSWFDFRGELDEVRVWHCARSQGEIVANMTHELVGNESGLAAYFKFNETSGSTAIDEVSHSRFGVVQAPSFLASSGTLDAVRLDTNLTVLDGARVTVLNGLVVNSVLQLSDTTSLLLTGSQTLSGSGQLVSIGSGGSLNAQAISGPSTLLVGPGLTFRGNWSLSVAGNASILVDNNDLSAATLSVTGPASATVIMENNWWGSTDPAVIETKITHHADNASLPLVDYKPWLLRSPIGYDGFYVTGQWPESGKATDFLDITFNKQADLGEFTPQDVSLVGSTGSVQVTGIEHVERSTYRIRYPYADLVNGGSYHLTVGPDVRDQAGHPMDQNLSGPFGEAGDVYTSTFIADLTPPRIVYQVPDGDVAGTVSCVDVVFNKPIDPATFTIADLQFTFPLVGYTCVPGLLHGVLPGSFNTTDPNPATDVQLGALAARGMAGAAWTDWTTHTYTGEILVGSSGRLALAEDFDDFVLIKIDGITRLESRNYADATASGLISLPPGWHTFELRLGQQNLIVGPVRTWSNWAVGYDPDGSAGTSTNQADYQEMLDNGSMNLFRVRGPQCSVAKVSDSRFRISFPAQTDVGQHAVIVGPQIADLVGNLMDQNRNGIRDEPADAYQAAFNLVDVDLELSNLLISTSQLWVDDTVHVSWNGANRAGYELLGDWTDAVYLSADDTWDMSDVLLASVPHTGGLAAGAPYSQAVDVTIPGIMSGDYRIIVRADMYGQEKEAGRHGNNVVASAALPLHVHALNNDGTPVSGTLSPSNRCDYYAVELPPRQNVKLTLDSAATAGANEIYVKRAGIPTRQDYDYRIIPGGPDAELTVPATYDGGTYYVLVYADQVSGTQAYQLKGQASGIFLSGVTPDHYGKQTPGTLSLTGDGFDDTTVVELIASDNSVVAPTRTNIISSTQATADFDLPAIPAGMYDVRVRKAGGAFDEKADVFTVVAGVGPRLVANLITPANVRVRGAQTCWIEYSNTGDAPMPAPLLRVSTDGAAYITLDPALRDNPAWPPPGVTDTITVWATGSGATPGTLKPGESGRIAFYYLGMKSGTSTVPYTLASVGADSTEPVDWASIKNDARPEWIAADAWDAQWSAFTAQMGATWGDFVRKRAEIVNYLQGIGEDAAGMSTNEILVFAIVQASQAGPGPILASAVDAYSTAPGIPLVFGRMFSQSPDARYRIGTLGHGWSSNWDYSVQVLSTGDVVVRGPGGYNRLFEKGATSGTFTPLPGDYGTLTSSGGLYRLREKGGTVYQFRSDLLLDYVEDTNGNRVTCGYSSGRLVTLTHSNGDTLTIAYNAQGRIASVTDPLGPGTADDRVTTFTYDASGTYLLSVTSPGSRVTTYTYQTSGGVAALHSLLSVGYADGKHTYFGYDAYGRVSETSADGGAERVTYSYPSLGTVVAADAAGVTTTVHSGSSTQPARIELPGSVVRLQYGSSDELAQLTGPEGQLSRFSYDARGDLTGIVDPTRGATQFAYEPTFNELTSLTDARGNGIDYAYDAKGNLTRITYEDGAHEDFTYDSAGNVLSWTNRRGQTVTYTYDASGQLTGKDYPDTPGVIDYVYTYDAAWNLTSAADAGGATTFAYEANTDWLTRIDYPGGKWFTFEYDAAGRRTKRTDQDGNVEDYAYDALGRLDRMTDGLAALIVDYDYDAAGRLVLKTLGNGVHTTYEYDAAGQLLHLVNRDADDSVLSRFDYAYNASGQRTSMTTLEGTWAYGYDASGQLTAVTYPDGHVVTYVYNAVGNRIEVIDDDVSTAYATNDMNQYSAVDGATYTFDADGNMETKTEGGVETRYTYDIENCLVKVEKGPTGQLPTDVWQYTFDGFGNRVASAYNSMTTNYVIDPIGLGNVAAEYDGSGNLVARYDYGYGLVAQTDSLGNGAYYTFSAIGNTSELTSTSGTILNSYSYDPFGISLAKSETVANPFEFVGEYGVMNEGTGLEFMRSRSYATTLGCFTTEDPLPLRRASRSYATNSPIQRIDPLGLESITVGFWYVTVSVGRDNTTGEWGVAVGVSVGAGAGVFVDENGKVSASAKAGLGGSVTYDPNGGVPQTSVEAGGQAAYGYGVAGSVSTEEGVSVKPVVGKGAEVSVSGQVQVYRSGGGHGQRKEDANGLEQNSKEKGSGEKTEQSASSTNTTSQSKSNVVRSYDPNDKIAPSGFSAAGYIQANNALSYRINFENVAQATAPAQRIVITDVLDDDLDLNTFELNEIVFGNHVISVPKGLSSYKTSVDLRPEGKNVVVQIDVSLDRETRTLTATLAGIDPATGWLPEDALVGILYPNDSTGRGDGHLSYLVSPKVGLASGTAIENQASIVFDWNDPIDTPKVLNTLDAAAPTSAVDALPAATGATEFPVAWAGVDEVGGSGVARYDVYVSDNGSAYATWLTDTTAISATFTGEDDHTYAFYSVAKDNVGHIEEPPPPSAPDAMTAVRIPPGVTAVEVNGGLAQRSCVRDVSVTFSEAVLIGQDAMMLHNDTTGIYVALSPDILSFDSTHNTATWRLCDLGLSDGNYTAMLLASEVTDGVGNHLDGDGDGKAGDGYRFTFHVLKGDANGDRKVNIFDLLLVRVNYLEPPGNGRDDNADLNCDGNVNVFDLLLVRQNYLRELAPGYTAQGFDFGPYVDGQGPPGAVTEEQIRERLKIIAPYTEWVHTYAALNGLERIPYIAKDLGLKVAMGCYIDDVEATNDAEIANLVAAAQAGMVDIAVVGNEVLQKGLASENLLVACVEDVKAQLDIPVTTAEAYEVLFARDEDGALVHADVVDACEVIFVSYYPFWWGVSLDGAMAALHAAHQDVLSVVGGKPVYVAETGWPSDGSAHGDAVPWPENAAFYFKNFVSWTRAEGVPYFYFEALDENWKVEPGDVGRHWGVWEEDGTMKPGMVVVFDGETMPDNWSGAAAIAFTSVPAWGSFDDLQGKVAHASPIGHNVAVYIYVAGGWWTKPTFADPLTSIALKGNWSCDITTGGIDEKATVIAAFLLPVGYAPPLADGLPTLPEELKQKAVASVQVQREPLGGGSGEAPAGMASPTFGGTIRTVSVPPIEVERSAAIKAAPPASGIPSLLREVAASGVAPAPVTGISGPWAAPATADSVNLLATDLESGTAAATKPYKRRLARGHLLQPIPLSVRHSKGGQAESTFREASTR